MRSRIVWMIPPSPFQVDNNSAYAWRVRWHSNLRSSCSTNQLQDSIPSPRAKWNPHCRNSRRNTQSFWCLTPCNRPDVLPIMQHSFCKVNLWNMVKENLSSLPPNKNGPKIILREGLDR